MNNPAEIEAAYRDWAVEHPNQTMRQSFRAGYCAAIAAALARKPVGWQLVSGGLSRDVAADHGAPFCNGNYTRSRDIACVCGALGDQRCRAKFSDNTNNITIPASK